MSLSLYDSLSRTVRPVERREPGKLGIYVCGPTVYDVVHVGNARPFVVAMVLKRHLERQGVQVTLVENITDVNDKIYAAARERGVSSVELAREMAGAFIEDTSGLGLGRPDVEPTVTDTIPEIVELIGRLVAAGLAYEADGDVYYRVGAFPSYGALSGQRPDELVEEARRIEPGEGKESPLDFALWKGRKPDEDNAWDSPWGPGRPGWHIECSAMAMKHLGAEFDVHGGGLDLIFPHHENERAQSEGANGHTFARTWMHNGMLRFGGDKMSKSLGNVESLHDALARVGATTLLMLLHQAHYRSPLDYTDATVEQARSACGRLREALRGARRVAAGDAPGAGIADAALAAELAATQRRFDAALDGDLATPEALAGLFDLARSLNAAVASHNLSAGAAAAAADGLAELLDVLGLRPLDPGPPAVTAAADVHRLARERDEARRRGDYALADRLRDEIAAAGFDVRDRPDGPELVPR